MNQRVVLANADHEIQRCYAVMAELRPDVQADEFLLRVKRQAEVAGYQLACLVDKEVKAVAGFRISECLAWGKFLWIDDLATRSGERSKGYGGALFDWLVAYAKQENCEQLHLDSSVLRFDAHRFYLHKRMIIAAPHFALRLQD